MLRNDLYKPWFVGEDWGVEIIDGEFSGVSLQITKLTFSEAEEGKLDIDYHIIHKPDIVTEESVKGDLFNNTLELIINDVVREAVENFEQGLEHDQIRNNNSSEPDQ